jgi:hypothetical protein
MRQTLMTAASVLLIARVAVSSPSFAFEPPPRNGTLLGVAVVNDGSYVVATRAVLTRITPDGNVTSGATMDLVNSKAFARVAGGFAFAADDPDSAWIARLNEEFRVVKAIRFPGASFNVSVIAGAADGGMFVGGGVPPRGDRVEGAALIRFRKSGEVAWQRELRTSGTGDFIAGLAEAGDGGVVAAGRAGCGASLWKISGDGRVEWQHCYAGPYSNLTNVVATSDGGFAATGREGQMLTIVKVDSQGRLEWRTIAAGAQARLVARGAHLIVAILGTSDYPQVYVASMNMARGAVEWQKTYASNALSPPMAVVPNRDGVLVAIANGTVVKALAITDRGTADTECVRLSDAALVFRDADTGGGDAAVEDLPLGIDFRSAAISTSPATSRAASVCGGSAIAGRSDDAPAVSAAAVPPPPDVFAVSREAAELLINRNFAELNRRADEYRRTRARFDPVYTKLDLFYDGVSLERVSQRVGEAAHRKLLEEWQRATPRSPAATLALAGFFNNVAAQRRGSAFEVSPKGGAESGTYRDMALKLLEQHADLANVDPEYWAALIEAKQNGRLYFDAGSARADQNVLRAAAIYLLPQWGGRPEDFHRLLETAVDVTKDEAGQTEYAELAYLLLRYVCCDADVWQAYAIDWERMKRGFLDWAAHSPLPTPLHRLAMFARGRNDRAAAREAFRRPEMVWNEIASAEWHNDRAAYENARKWALATDDTPLVQSRPKPPVDPLRRATVIPAALQSLQSSHTILRSDAVLKSGEHVKAWAFLAKTGTGIVAFSSASRVAREKLASGTLLVSGEPTGRIEVKDLVTSSKYPGSGVAFTVGDVDPRLNVRILEPRFTPALSGESLFIIACAANGPDCRQEVFEGKAASTESGSRVRGFDFEIEGIDAATLLGAPVLDEKGRVLAVVTRSGGIIWGYPAIECEELSSVLQKLP